jgi:hypothetical protein
VKDPSKHFIVFALESVAFDKGATDTIGGNQRMVDVILQDSSEIDVDMIRAKLSGQNVANSGGCTIGTAWFMAVYAQVHNAYPSVLRSCNFAFEVFST